MILEIPVRNDDKVRCAEIGTTRAMRFPLKSLLVVPQAVQDYAGAEQACQYERKHERESEYEEEDNDDDNHHQISKHDNSRRSLHDKSQGSNTMKAVARHSLVIIAIHNSNSEPVRQRLMLHIACSIAVYNTVSSRLLSEIHHCVTSWVLVCQLTW